MPDRDDDLMPATEVARMLGVTPDALRMRRMRGTENPRGIKIGNSAVYRRSEVEAALAARKSPRKGARD
jgi:predicted DNA-binding transcriptional regulator AlpA